jgi:hypothetical protein
MNSTIAHWQWAVDTAYASVFCAMVTGYPGYRLSRSSSPFLSSPERDNRETETGFWRNSWILFFKNLVARVFLVLFLLDFISGDFLLLSGVFRSVYVCFFSIFLVGKKAEGAMAHSRHNQNEENSDDYDPTPYRVDLLLRVFFLDFFWL